MKEVETDIHRKKYLYWQEDNIIMMLRLFKEIYIFKAIPINNSLHKIEKSSF